MSENGVWTEEQQKAGVRGAVAYLQRIGLNDRERQALDALEKEIERAWGEIARLTAERDAEIAAGIEVHGALGAATADRARMLRASGVNRPGSSESSTRLAEDAGERVREVLLSAVRTAQNGEQGRREYLGRLVRKEWIKWAREQPSPKASWLVPWEGLSEPDKEVDRRIGERLYSVGVLSVEPVTASLEETTPLTAAAIDAWADRFSAAMSGVQDIDVTARLVGEARRWLDRCAADPLATIELAEAHVSRGRMLDMRTAPLTEAEAHRWGTMLHEQCVRFPRTSIAMASTTPHHRGFQNGEVVTWLDPPRDAATLENRVLSLCQGWAADRERDTAARLTAAEVELAAVRAEAASLRREICETHARLTEAGIARLETDTLLQRVSDLTAQRDGARGRADRFERMLTEARAQVEGLRIGLEAAVERARRWERHARALAGVARWMRSALLDCDDVTLSDLRAMAKGAQARLARIEADRDTRDDAPPPTQPSERRAAAPPSPPRFRTAVVGGDR